MLDAPQKLEDVEKMIASQTQESLHLDYKDSRAIDLSKRAEIAKDVSAFANSDGGLIIYGVSEKDNLPFEIDGGVDHKRYSREWVEQVINSNISPRIAGIQIYPILMSELRSIYVIQIPKSYRGPHQSSDKRYYRRFNFQSVPMEDYEIADVRNRFQTVPPLINIDVEVQKGSIIYLVVENVGNFPAKDVSFKFTNGVVWPNNEDLPPVFKRGVKVFPPKRIYRYHYHPYVTIVNDDAVPKTLDIEVAYTHTQSNQTVIDNFHSNYSAYVTTTGVYL